MTKYKPGDTVTFTITGKIERIRGDSVVVYAHGVEIPLLASQIGPAIGPLWEIAKAVAEADTYVSATGDVECCFCDGMMDNTHYIHQDDCVVMKARELLEREQPKP